MSREQLLREVTRKYEDAYRKRTPKSRATMEAARKFMPGGDTRSSIWFEPYPIWIDKAEGCRFSDVDGNEYIDFHNCYTTMILGHANPRVVAAVREQAAKGTALGALIPTVVRWAELVCNFAKSVDQVRFTNSGTEAVMMALRVARAFTGKDMILKTDGCYHGSYDPVVYPSDSPGISRSAQGDAIIVPYNDKEAAERAIVENRDKLAAVIVEGAMGAAGMIPPRDGYLQFLRKVTAENGVLFILDEVISLRLAVGGTASIFGIKPDLVTMAKIIGGGYPVGAVGGREEIMRLFAPEAQAVVHSGTLNANPITATAGVATMEQLDAAAIDHINKLGESFADGVRAVFKRLNIKGQVTGIGSLQNIHFSDKPVVDGKSAREANKDLLHLFYLAMQERGCFSAARGLYVMSTPMTQREIDTAVSAVEDALAELKPTIEELWPELIG
ncbi:MAG TPA: aspartate aminotransferase family protein [Dehalococcoidia bacterium]|jgi:glutamate-1-semialdehyde 2,1-aminomutase|nr:aspartate aminotransferase family protein [Dehalococcoidia bacterium]